MPYPFSGACRPTLRRVRGGIEHIRLLHVLADAARRVVFTPFPSLHSETSFFHEGCRHGCVFLLLRGIRCHRGLYHHAAWLEAERITVSPWRRRESIGSWSITCWKGCRRSPSGSSMLNSTHQTRPRAQNGCARCAVAGRSLSSGCRQGKW